MSVWGKLFSAVRGGVNEAAETAADSQALRILDQEIRDAENALRRARSDLAGIKTKAVRAALSYDFGFATLSYFGGYQESTLHRDNDQDGGLAFTYGFQQNEKVKDQNHELRIVSNSDSAFTWQGGLYYFKESDDLLTFFQVNSPPAAPFNFYTFDYLVRSQSKAAFAQVGESVGERRRIAADRAFHDDHRSRDQPLVVVEEAQVGYASTVFHSWLLVISGEVRRTGPREATVTVTVTVAVAQSPSTTPPPMALRRHLPITAR